MHLFGMKLPAMSSLLLWALLWEIVGQMDLTFFVPPLSQVFATLFEIIGTPAFLKALWETAYAFFMGVFFAIAIGIPVGILMGKSRLLDELLLPWVNIFVSRAADRAGAGADGALRLRPDLDHHHHHAVRDLDHHPQRARRRAADQPLAGRHGAQLRRLAAGRLLQDLFLGGLPEILGGVRIGVIRAVKGVIIGQLLISIVGFGALFELYASNFLMGHFWAVLIVLFALAFSISEFLGYLERKVAYYAAKR